MPLTYVRGIFRRCGRDRKSRKTVHPRFLVHSQYILAKTENKRCPTSGCKASLSGADETRTGLLVAERYGMPERTFKRWLSTSLFRKITHCYYEKRYR